MRYGTRVLFSFRYLIARGTVGETRVRLTQYRDTPSSCRVLPEGGFDRELDPNGTGWKRFEQVVRVGEEATTLGIDFRISNDINIGEMWIEDLRIIPVEQGTPETP